MGKNDREGIYAREASIRIFFIHDGERYYETLSISPTPANLKYAASVRKEILRRIEIGTFDFSEFFPKSKNAPHKDRPTFGKISDAWLESKGRKLAETTVKEYRTTINAYFTEPFGKRIMSDITFLEVDRLMSSLKVSNKTFNNILSVLRGIYIYSIKAKSCTENHAAHIEFTVKEETAPDPLSRNEVVKVLQDMHEHFHEQIEIYFSLAFRIGYRPSEGIDLRWSNIDWDDKTLMISSAKVRTVTKDTKTHKSRIIELDEECIALLTRLKKHTFMVGDHVFTNPAKGTPFPNTADLVQKYWRPSLKRCKIHNRDARQTRHTCATMMLMAGCKPAWAAHQLGHSIEMFLRTYSKWLPENDKGAERAKLSAMFGAPATELATSLATRSRIQTKKP